MMEQREIFTIGYGSRTTDEFIALLKRFKIDVLVDVRTQPYSSYQSNFSKLALAALLGDAQIGYEFMGDSLGGRPDDESCYSYSPTRKKRVLDRAKCETKDGFTSGTARVMALAAEKTIALMCGCLDPRICHRGYILGASLADKGTKVIHIDKDGSLTAQAAIPAIKIQPELL